MRKFLAVLAFAALASPALAQRPMGPYGGFGPPKGGHTYDRPWTSQAGSHNTTLYRGPAGDVVPTDRLPSNAFQQGYGFAGNVRGYNPNARPSTSPSRPR